MSKENKLFVDAPIIIVNEVSARAQEKASTLAFPEEKQHDLQYIRSILVSAGTNKNGAHFLPSEMLKAHNTVVNKAIDVEHEESKVIGHIYECAFLYKSGDSFDPVRVASEYKESGKNVDDELDMDIAVAGVIHKMRFPEMADEISAGLWRVSMECYFRDFDIKIGNNIISRNEAMTLGYDPDLLVKGFVKVTAGLRELGVHAVARVLRDITFSGMGIVKNPANPHSIILETAAHKEAMEKNTIVVDLERIDNLRGHTVEIATKGETQVVEDKEKSDNLVKAVPMLDGARADDLYIEVNKETGGIKRILSVSKEEGSLRWSGPGIKGPGSVTTYPEDICKSFKKRFTRFNALDQSEAQVLHEHWCALFEEPCPVIGASAKAPECLRNVRNSITKSPDDTTITKTIREHLEKPNNEFTTVLQFPVLTHNASVKLDERKEELARIKANAESLRNSLRSFVASEKKTLK